MRNEEPKHLDHHQTPTAPRQLPAGEKEERGNERDGRSGSERESPTRHTDRPTVDLNNLKYRHKPAPLIQLPLGTDPPFGRTQTSPTPVLRRESPSPQDPIQDHKEQSRYGRIGSTKRHHLLQNLSRRDREILLGLSAHKFLTTDQLRRLFFYDHQTPRAGARAASRVLARLKQHRLIHQLGRTVGGHGGGSSTYLLCTTNLGEQLVAIIDGRDKARRQRYDRPTRMFQQHILAINETRLRLIEADRAGTFELLSTQLEPDCWRPYLNRHGQPAQLKPDLFAITQTLDFTDHWMIEIDLNSEHLPAVLRKCQAVQLYHDRGTEQHQHGLFPLTLWVAPDQKRARHIAETIYQAQIDNALFRVVTMDDFIDLIAAGGTQPHTPATKGGILWNSTR